MGRVDGGSNVISTRLGVTVCGPTKPILHGLLKPICSLVTECTATTERTAPHGTHDKRQAKDSIAQEVDPWIAFMLGGF